MVVEELTLWVPEARAAIEGWDAKQRKRFERCLQAEPAAAEHLEYVRVHTGFCRQITVQPADITRLANHFPVQPEDVAADVQ